MSHFSTSERRANSSVLTGVISTKDVCAEAVYTSSSYRHGGVRYSAEAQMTSWTLDPTSFPARDRLGWAGALCSPLSEGEWPFCLKERKKEKEEEEKGSYQIFQCIFHSSHLKGKQGVSVQDFPNRLSAQPQFSTLFSSCHETDSASPISFPGLSPCFAGRHR